MTTDAPIRPEHEEAAAAIHDACNMAVLEALRAIPDDEFDAKTAEMEARTAKIIVIAQALANAERDGRKEGLEEAAKHYDRLASEAHEDANFADLHGDWPNSGKYGKREERFKAHAKAIRALQNTPGEETPRV